MSFYHLRVSERSAVQNPLLRYAQEIGWQYVAPEEALALRGGETGLFFRHTLEQQLQRLNPGIVDGERAAEIAHRLSLLKPTIEGNRDALSWLRGEESVFVPGERRERNVRLVDFENPDTNVFHVTDEWRQKGVVFANRADAVFLINGIPVAIAETKAAHKQDGLEEGITQIRRYHRETPEMLIAPQVFEVTHLVGFFYGATWSTNRKNLFNWKDEVEGDYERKVKAFFDRLRMLRLLRDYVVFLAKDDVLSKVVLRQHQTRAVEKVLDRVYDPAKRHGLIWHTQGSGKTLTMITVASKLLHQAGSESGGEKPTVLMLVDRNELEQQLFKNIDAYGIGTVEVAQSKADLQSLFAADYRGLIVSTIHKFEGMPANACPRESVVVLVDEAHRTTGGDLGNYLMGALPNATYIGFTGTPVDKLYRGQGTFKVFGPDDPQGYLDKYSIAESIQDGTTVALNYALAPSNLRIDRETLEREFLSLAASEGVSDPEELNAILDKAVALKEVMKAPERVARIAAHAAQHFRENVEPMGFKAFLVAVDREACVFYKEALDRHLPAEYSQVVISAAHNDAEHLKRHYLDEEAEKRVRATFIKRDALPKILIVTEKLLTGFDAPVLYCLYLDKPMRDHVLLQAIARVNRPYDDEDGVVKPYGFVLDYVGIFEKLERALAFDSDVVESVIQNIDVLKGLFATLMRETAPQYLPLARGWDDKSKERAIDHFLDKTKREALYKFFGQVQTLYEILSPDGFLRAYMDDYQALAALYALIRNAYSEHVYADRELTEKTRRLLRERTATLSVALPGAIHALGPDELAALRESDASDNAKVLNLRKVLAATVEQESKQKPFLIPIGERAEALTQAYEDRQLTTQLVLSEFEKLAQEYVNAEAERDALDLDQNAYAIYASLKGMVENASAEDARAVDLVFGRYPDFRWNQRQQATLRAELYKSLRPIVGPALTVAAANALLQLQRV